MRRLLTVSLFALAAASAAGSIDPAHADDCTGPYIAYGLDYEAFGNFMNSGDGWYYDIYPSLETEVSLEAGNGLALNTDVIVESMIDPVPGENRAFGDIGVYFKRLRRVGGCTYWLPGGADCLEALQA